jgi:hypothetical protein
VSVAQLPPFPVKVCAGWMWHEILWIIMDHPDINMVY